MASWANCRTRNAYPKNYQSLRMIAAHTYDLLEHKYSLAITLNNQTLPFLSSLLKALEQGDRLTM